MKNFGKVAAAAAVACSTMAAHSAPLVIDDFAAPTSVIVLPPIPPVFPGGSFPVLTDSTILDGGMRETTNAASGIVGKQRDIYVEKTSGATSSSVVGKVEAGQFSLDVGSNMAGTAYLKWDGAFDPVGFGTETKAGFLASLGFSLANGGLGSLDLTQSGNAFAIAVQDSDVGFDFAMSVFSASGARSTTLVLAAAPHSNGNPGPQPIMFDDFAGVTPCTLAPVPLGLPAGSCVLASGAIRIPGQFGFADMTDVDALMAQINFSGVSTSFDITINQVSVVPEPASLALFGAALLGLGAVRRRKTTK